MTESVIHPEIWVLSELLRAAGIDRGPEFALGVAGGAGAVAVWFRYDRGDRAGLHLSGWNPFQSDLPGAAQRLGLIDTLDETSRRRRAARSLDAALASGRPMALWLDLASVGLAPDEDRGASPGVVLARADEAGTIHLADGARAVTLDASDVAAARSVHGPQQQRLLTLREASDLDLENAARTGLARLAVGASGGPKGDGGPASIRRLAAAMVDDGPTGWEATFAGGSHLGTALSSLHDAIVRERGLLRTPQAEFERWAAGVLDRPELSQRASELNALAADWHALAVEAGGFAADGRAQDAAVDAVPSTDPVHPDALVSLSGQLQKLADREAASLDGLRAALRASRI